MLFENILRFGHVKFSPCFASASTAVEVRLSVGFWDSPIKTEELDRKVVGDFS